MTVRPQDIQNEKLSGWSKAAEKARLRREFLAGRNALPQGTVESLSRAVLRRIWALRAVREMEARKRVGETVWLSCYVDFDREVRTRPLMCKALERGYRLAVPVVPPGREGGLILSEVKDVPGSREPGSGWVRSRWGLFEPRDPRPVEPGRMDCFVIPGVVFDRRGFRLGFGKGYYDGLLASARTDAWRIGLAFSSQLAGRLPRAEWDVPMHRIVTESGVVRCNPIGGVFPIRR
ncbi:MAG: 5-formyltetrahydrofolate cyclo-ligase [Nitrospinota bacterium]